MGFIFDIVFYAFGILIAIAILYGLFLLVVFYGLHQITDGYEESQKKLNQELTKNKHQKLNHTQHV
jgi:hypothetical protein